MKKTMNEKMKNRKGFTLIELIVVIAILGILAAIAIPRFTGMRQEATVKAEGATATSILSAARIQEADLGKAPAGETAAAVVNKADTTAVSDLENGEILNKYMILPTEGVTDYKIAKTGDIYIITWTTKASGVYASKVQTLTENKPFTANQS